MPLKHEIVSTQALREPEKLVGMRGRFVMRDRALMPDTRGWGRSVHTLQRMPEPAPRNTDQTMASILRVAGTASEQAA